MITEFDMGVIRKVQEVQLQTMKDFAEFCERHHLRYYVYWARSVIQVLFPGMMMSMSPCLWRIIGSFKNFSQRK